MSNLITKDVGTGCPNLPADVALVQRLLNDHILQLIPYAMLQVDGLFAPPTADLIEQFQSRVVKMTKPDGVVSTRGQTIRALASDAGQGPNPPKPKQPASGNHYPAHVSAFITMALPAAKTVSQTWNIPVSVILAQSALESGWGQHVKQNAYFGIKGHSPSGKSTSFGTTEVINGKVIHIKDTFRAYTDYADAADDYGRFLNENKIYAAAFAFSKDPLKFVAAVAKAGYATSPDYQKSLTSIIVGFKLTQYDTP